MNTTTKPPPSQAAMDVARKVKLCTGCDMAGRQCDDCRAYPYAIEQVARALDAFAAKAVEHALAEEREDMVNFLHDECGVDDDSPRMAKFIARSKP